MGPGQCGQGLQTDDRTAGSETTPGRQDTHDYRVRLGLTTTASPDAAFVVADEHREAAIDCAAIANPANRVVRHYDDFVAGRSLRQLLQSETQTS